MKLVPLRPVFRFGHTRCVRENIMHPRQHHSVVLARGQHSARGYTLLEILIVVVLLGIAGAMVVPVMGNSNVMRVQGAIRQLVADITFAQADAVAFQERRAIVFDVPNSTYRLVQVPGNTIDINANTMYDPTKPTGRWVVDFRTSADFGDARIASAAFDSGSSTLIFDALGGPVASASSNNPGTGGTIRLTGSGQTWRINVEAFTGRITATLE